MAERRKRYEVTRRRNTKTETFHVLEYERPNTIKLLADYYSKGGWLITSVHKVTRGNPGEGTPRATAAWKIDDLNLRKAIAELGIEWPVRIKLTGFQGGRGGAHQLRYSTEAPRGITLPRGTLFYHHITLKKYLDVKTAGRYAWHELTHAMQAERVIKQYIKNQNGYYPPLEDQRTEWHLAYNPAYGSGGKTRTRYATRPFEIEANKMMRRNASIPLARKIS